jgi:hypothetical protein
MTRPRKRVLVVKTKEQVRTVSITWEDIMLSRAFLFGVEEVRSGRRPDYDRSRFAADIDAQWNYERGRQWALSAPKDLPLKIGKRLNPLAVMWGRDII